MTPPQLAWWAKQVAALDGVARVVARVGGEVIGECGPDQPDLAEALALLATDYVTACARTCSVTFRAENETGAALRTTSVRFFTDIASDGAQTTNDVVRMLAQHNHQYASLILQERQAFMDAMQRQMDQQQRFYNEAMERLMARLEGAEREREETAAVAREAIAAAEENASAQRRVTLADRLENMLGDALEKKGLKLLEGGAGDAPASSTDAPAAGDGKTSAA